MKFNDARSEAVLGARITSDTIQTGAFVDYQFNGLRIVFPAGSHSQFRPTEDDLAADWHIVPMEFQPQLKRQPPKWGTAKSVPNLAFEVFNPTPEQRKWGAKFTAKRIDVEASLDSGRGETHSPKRDSWGRPL